MNKELLKEDIEQYNDTKEMYDQLEVIDIDLAFDLAKRSLILADRWNDIMYHSSKYRNGCSKTDFKNFAYHKYRILMQIHEDCRVIWRQAKEDLRNSFYSEL